MDDRPNIEHLEDGGMRIHGEGGSVVVRPPDEIGLRTLSIESPDGQLVHTIVLDDDDAHRLVQAMDDARLEMELTGAPVAVEIDRLLGRD